MNRNEFILANSAVVIDYFYCDSEELVDTDKVGKVTQHIDCAAITIYNSDNKFVDVFYVDNHRIDGLIEELG